jgi:MerR family mercuric resistance operon transcriptional regulator
MKSLRIGEVARRVGCTVETVRFYERKGLLDEPSRRPSGYRLYEQEDVGRLRFVRRAKELGFTLREIQELVSLRTDPVTACPDVHARAEAKISDIEARIVALEGIRKALVKLVAACKRRARTCKCPILETLEHWDGE